ncbi:MAG TPA: YraN family protein [Syntrophobacteraceae bacterium]|jgi:putative endonuclease|nr:YraN family protein [Syntrophobacteraceae bacterium]
MMANRPEKGRLSEAVAAEFLVGQGLAIVAQNIRCPLGEIDLVARQGNIHVFVEVKSRFALGRGLPQEAVTRAKRKRLTRLAQWYIQQHRLHGQPARFDVIAITWQGNEPSIRWIPNAFEATV